MLRGEAVMGGRRAETDVIRIGDAAGEREKIVVAQGFRALLRRVEQVASPGSTFEPPFMAKRFNNMVRSLRTDAKQLNDLRPRCVAAAARRESQDDPALLRGQGSGSKHVISFIKTPRLGVF